MSAAILMPGNNQKGTSALTFTHKNDKIEVGNESATPTPRGASNLFLDPRNRRAGA
jgi:hypothetical protein